MQGCCADLQWQMGRDISRLLIERGNNAIWLCLGSCWAGMRRCLETCLVGEEEQQQQEQHERQPWVQWYKFDELIVVVARFKEETDKVRVH